MSEQMTVGDLVVAFLEACDVKTAFGIISIHNLPIADAIARRGSIRFVPVRNEAGAVNMADAGARLTGRIGVAITSTGGGVGNACTGLLECMSAGTPLLHLTGNVETSRIDRVTGYTHETPGQFRLLEGASKAAFRVRAPETALGILRDAVRLAMTPPMGAVSVEIPIDVQKALMPVPADLVPSFPAPIAPASDAVARVASILERARRPMIWLGGGAVHASAAARQLAQMGVGVMSSVQGRGIVPDDHPRNLGAFTSQDASVAFLQRCDFCMVVGSKLRSAQTRGQRLPLPRPLVVVDADTQAENRNYIADLFVHADAKLFLAALAERVGTLATDAGFDDDLARARRDAKAELCSSLGPYEPLLDAVSAHAPPDFNWVRDITMNNSTWGNRLPALREPRQGVYAVGGGIGQGLAQGIGAAITTPGRKTIALVGDGGLSLSLGELATAVQENANVAIIVMNDGGYGIMRNLQDAHFEGRRFAADLVMPDFALIAQSLGIPYLEVRDASRFDGALAETLAHHGPSILEANMKAIGPFAKPFAGPPVVYARPDKISA